MLVEKDLKKFHILFAGKQLFSTFVVG